MNGASDSQRRPHRELQRVLVRHRQGSRQAEAYGADVGVGRGPEGSRAAAEHLRQRAQLHVRLEPDHRLPSARHYASSPAGTARSSAYAASSISSSRNACPMSWPPIGRPLMLPIGMEIAGRHARFAVTVKMSERYIATGSLSFSPALNAGVGVVGVNSRSTPRSKTLRKSCAISARIC